MFCAPTCNTPISTIHHSVRFVEEITAILSFFLTPNLSKALLSIFDLSK